MKNRENINVLPNPSTLPQEWIDRAKKLSTTLLSDGLDFPVEMNYDMKPANRDSILIGAALTIRTTEGDNLAVHHAMYNAKEGHVLIVAANGSHQGAIIGELMVAAAKALHLNGFVIDGLIRDYGNLSKSDFPVFSLGSISRGPTKNGPGSINSVITCAGRVVQPGDFIMGDADGVIAIPRDKAEEALIRAEKKAKYEEERLKNIAEGNIRPNWL